MKIRKIKTYNHQILGDFELDFTDREGEVIDTIIFAGENGTGKTAILELIYSFSNYNIEPARNEKREIEIQLTKQDFKILKNNPNIVNILDYEPKDYIFKFYFDYNITGNWQQVRVYTKAADTDSLKEMFGHIFTTDDTRKILKTIFTQAEISYSPGVIKNVTSLNLDETNYNSCRTKNETPSDITQLLIDIDTLDALEFRDFAYKNPNELPVIMVEKSRISRFTHAFNSIFITKKYERVININGEKKVMFSEFDKEMSIENLSSGEKQIVFRGGFLLKDINSNKGAVILIDEPEISLHPGWQINIVNFYKNLFIDNEGKQTSQIFFATHSPFVIHNSNRSNDKIIILKKDDKGNIFISDKPTYYNWTEEELIEDAFNFNLFKEKSKIFILLEGETDEKYFTKAQEIFKCNNEKFCFKWVGKMNQIGNAVFTGKSALNQAKNCFISNPYLIKSKIILLYDNDTNVCDENIGNVFVKKMTKNNENSRYQIGSENLLVLPEGFIYNDYIVTEKKKDCYGCEKILPSLNKSKLCNFVCNNENEDLQRTILKNIHEIILQIEQEY